MPEQPEGKDWLSGATGGLSYAACAGPSAVFKALSDSRFLYSASYIKEIRLSVRKMSRRELRRLMTIRHGQRIPKDVNLRNYVSKFHAHQQAINAGAKPSNFWRAAVGLHTEVNTPVSRTAGK